MVCRVNLHRKLNIYHLILLFLFYFSLFKALDKKNFKTFYSKACCLSSIKVDESKRPLSAQNYMREYKDIEGTTMGSKGTFISLNPDD